MSFPPSAHRMMFLDQTRDFLLRDLAPNVSLGRINQELRHAQMIDILQTDGDAPIARPLPDFWVGGVFELGKDIPCGFRRTYSFIMSCHTETRSSLSNDMHTHFWNVPFQNVARKDARCRFIAHSPFAFRVILYQKFTMLPRGFCGLREPRGSRRHARSAYRRPARTFQTLSVRRRRLP